MKKKNETGLEITTFKLKGCTIEQFITANADIDAFLKRQPGFQSRHMAEQKDGTIVDMLFWDSVADGERAMHQLMDEMAASAVHDMINQGTVVWDCSPVKYQLLK